MGRYNQRIEILRNPSEAGLNEKGNWIAGSQSEFKLLRCCRYEINTQARQITLLDGSAYFYTYEVFLPLFSDNLSPGTFVRLLREDGTEETQGPIKGFSKSRFNVRIWL